MKKTFKYLIITWIIALATILLGIIIATSLIPRSEKGTAVTTDKEGNVTIVKWVLVQK